MRHDQLFEDTPTKHRVRRNDKKRVVYARYDWQGNFVRYVLPRTKAELAALRKEYGPSVNLQTWYEVHEEEFV